MSARAAGPVPAPDFSCFTVEQARGDSVQLASCRAHVVEHEERCGLDAEYGAGRAAARFAVPLRPADLGVACVLMMAGGSPRPKGHLTWRSSRAVALRIDSTCPGPAEPDGRIGRVRNDEVGRISPGSL